MKKARREFLRLAASAGASSLLSGIALAQKYPARPVRLVVGYAAGGAADTLARLSGRLSPNVWDRRSSSRIAWERAAISPRT